MTQVSSSLSRHESWLNYADVNDSLILIARAVCRVIDVVGNLTKCCSFDVRAENIPLPEKFGIYRPELVSRVVATVKPWSSLTVIPEGSACV